MKFRILLSLLFFVGCFKTHGQKPKLEIRNGTGQRVQVYITAYSSDSTKSYGYSLYCESCGEKHYGEARHIRKDYIGIDDETKDTLFQITANKNDFESGLIVFQNGANTLKPLYIIRPRLRINSKGYQRLFNVGDPVELKLMSGGKATGNVVGYSSEKISIQNEANEIVEMSLHEVKSIRRCGHLYSIGSRFSFWRYCNYKKLKEPLFELVEQQFNTERNYWQWVNIEE